MSAPELLPCPWCENGEPKELVMEKGHLTGWWMTCERCGTSGPWGDTKEEAERLWNTRAGAALLREALEGAICPECNGGIRSDGLAYCLRCGGPERVVSRIRAALAETVETETKEKK